MAHALPRPGVSEGPRPVPVDAVRARAGARDAQADPAQPPPRDRNLHLGRPPRPPQDRRHRRIRLPRGGMGEGAASVASVTSRGTDDCRLTEGWRLEIEAGRYVRVRT